MIKPRDWSKLGHFFSSLSSGTLAIGIFTIVNKFLGLYRDRLLASTFGAGGLLDSYYAAFRLPDLIFNTLVLGALSSAFIPVFAKLYYSDPDKAKKVASTTISYLALVLVFITIIGEIFTPWLVKIFTPGFSSDQLALTTNLTRVMLLSLVFFGVSNVFGGVLNSFKKFLAFSIAPIFYNLGIVLGIVVFFKSLGPIGLAYGVVLGAILHCLIQFIAAKQAGFVWQPLFKYLPEVKRIIYLMIPRTLGLAAGQINEVIMLMIASGLPAGSISEFNFAYNLQTVPMSVIAIPFAITIFPILSESLITPLKHNFIQIFSRQSQKIVFFMAPLTALILVERAQIVRLILGSGNFDWANTYFTAQTLGAFSISLLAQSLLPLVSRCFYALEDTKTPVMVGLGTIILNIFLAMNLVKYFGVVGLALSFSITSVLNFVVLYILLHHRVGHLDDENLFWSILRSTFGSCLAGIVAYLSLNGLAMLVDMRSFLGILTQSGLATIFAIITYLLFHKLLRSPEINYFKTIFSSVKE